MKDRGKSRFYHCSYCSFPGEAPGFSYWGKKGRIFIPTGGVQPSFGDAAHERVQRVLEQRLEKRGIQIVFH